jgi:hypothetical protein
MRVGKDAEELRTRIRLFRVLYSPTHRSTYPRTLDFSRIYISFSESEAANAQVVIVRQ